LINRHHIKIPPDCCHTERPETTESYIALQIVLSLFLRKPFNCIAQHCSWHFVIMPPEKIFRHGHIPLPDLTQHLAYSLVDQIFTIIQHNPGNIQCVCEIILPDEMEGGHDGNSPLPEIGGAGQVVKRFSVSLKQIGANYVLG